MLPAGARLRRSADFTATLRASRATRADNMLVLHAALPTTATGTDQVAAAPARIGFVVPRTVGPAVTRNRVRRRLRHLLRDRLERLPAGGRFVVRVLPSAAAAPYPALAAALDRALDRALPPPAPAAVPR
ncbi:MAG: ribonuclease P protein component [Sporichthyaceae bacterium]